MDFEEFEKQQEQKLAEKQQRNTNTISCCSTAQDVDRAKIQNKEWEHYLQYGLSGACDGMFE